MTQGAGDDCPITGPRTAKTLFRQDAARGTMRLYPYRNPLLEKISQKYGVVRPQDVSAASTPSGCREPVA
jgi:hypothetical protein